MKDTEEWAQPFATQSESFLRGYTQTCSRAWDCDAHESGTDKASFAIFRTVAAARSFLAVVVSQREGNVAAP